jgi:hypothetical protein
MVVLLVDGDEATRHARAALLRAHLHEVMESATAVEAVHWAQQAGSIDLLITEVILDAETFGFDLSEAILARLPNMRTLYTTRFDLAGYEAELRGSKPLLATATDETFLSAIEEAVGSPDEAVPVAIALDEPPIMPPGAMLGQYQIINRLYSETEAETYRAMQYTVQRPVALVLLRPHLLTNADALNAFKERERVKAQVSHPRIAPLYEAGVANGWHYYTREMPPGRSLEDIASAGEQLGERVIVDVLYCVSEAMSYAVEQGFNYRTLSLRDIYADAENQVSIVNIFRPATTLPRDQRADVRSLLESVFPFATQGKARGLLHDLDQKPHDWAELFAAVQDIREDMSERSLMRRAEVENITVAPAHSRRWLIGVGMVAAFGVVAWLGGLSSGIGSGSPAKRPSITDEWVPVPEGPFIYQKNEKLTLPAFWISKHEVTIGQYAAFLEALKTAPTKAFDDENQPSSKTSHTPTGWADYHAAAKAGALFNNEGLTLNSPVSGVDYWDAVAYAKWSGRRLPTEQEWEKAARGSKGNLFPWGNDPKPGAANLGDDYVAKAKGGKIDGHNLWAPVDSMPDDVSECGAVGMAGNVQEWTSTWSPHPELPDTRVPVLRGGHFGLRTSKDLLTSRHFAESADEATPARGFRTVSEKQP